MTLSLNIDARDGAARATTVTTRRSTFATPCFMPVGTRGAVKTLAAVDLEALGAEVILANTYHLMLRPGVDVVAKLGGIHAFSGWSGHVLTDSGGFQVFSLSPKVDDDGVTFKSTYDGSSHRLTPEAAVQAQLAIDADIQMVLDECSALPAPRDVLADAVVRTAAWAARAKAEHDRGDTKGQSLFGIVQGGADALLRAESAQRTVDIGFVGYGIGGLSVGEPHGEMLDALSATIEHLPTDAPRYLMGVGDPAGLVEAIALGVDMFDCVLPTRLGRHGTALTGAGRLSLNAATVALDHGPVEDGCTCSTCARHSRAYLRHLFQVGEPTAPRLLTIHNLAWVLGLLRRARAAVIDGTLDALRREVAVGWGHRAQASG